MISTLSPTLKRPSTESRSFPTDRKSTRLNSSHSQISYAVFCLKKKKRRTAHSTPTNHLHANRCDPLPQALMSISHIHPLLRKELLPLAEWRALRCRGVAIRRFH